MTAYWHPFADMAAVARHGELVLASGSGSTVVDTDGREYLDATGALWFCNVGHGRAEIARAVQEQMGALASYSTFGDVAPAVTLELAGRLVARSPHPDGSVFLTSGGSDAVDSAIKLALRYWEEVGQSERTTVIRRSGAYHGMHLGGTAIAGIAANRTRATDGGIRSVEVAWDDAEDLHATIARLGAANVAAFFCEPVLGAGGVWAPPDGYLQRVEEICGEHGVLFVLDEVITGFGRLGHTFAAERFGLSPDLILFAKGVTSGYLPLGGMVAGPRVMEPFWSEPGRATWRHGYTYSGHAAVAAAALANLDVLDADGLFAAGDRLEGEIAGTFGALADLDQVEEVRAGTGALAAVALHPDLVASHPALPADVVSAARDRGLLTRVITGGALQVSPPLCTSTEQVDAMAARLADAIGAAGP
ncbi:aspartate aminotransferase family protein [soil metagenome]